MNTLYRKIGLNEAENIKALQEAAEIIKNGGLVAFPTETVYGLGANALSREAAEKIYAAKGRPSDNPLIVHISDISMLTEVARDIGPKALKLAETFWPGPLTMVLKKKSIVPNAITGGLDTVAVRIPESKTALELINMSALPLAGPSANSSTKPSPTCAEHVMEDLDGKIDMVLDAGHTAYGIESTIVDAATDRIRLLRPGVITAEMLIEAIGDIDISFELPHDKAPVSPGMKYKHYSPAAKITIVKGGDKPVADYIKIRIKPCQSEKAVITTDECLKYYTGYKNVYSLGPKCSPAIIGENLFDILRRLDADNISFAYAHAIVEEGIGRAVMNRLTKAAAGDVIDLSLPESVKILFVCTGNTCRSPMAQAILNFADSGCMGFSRGIHAVSGDSLSVFADAALKEMGIFAGDFRATPLCADDIEKARLVLCMTKNHAEYVKSKFPRYKDKIHTIYQYAAKTEKDVLDPFGQSIEIYRKCAAEIKGLIDKIIELHTDYSSSGLNP